MEREGQASEKRKYRRGTVVAAVAVGALVVVGAASHFATEESGQAGGRNQETRQERQEYPLHTDIIATVFWVGEAADASNDYIQNRSSFWMEDWMGAYGGVDDPDDRCGYRPCAFEPKENPFYIALPYADTSHGRFKPADELETIPWYDGNVEEGESLLKNRWVKLVRGDTAAYAQWQDVGPFGEEDDEYVFGDQRPAEPRAGIDLSPATAAYLGIDGRGVVDWQFVDAEDVPDGPWLITVTTSPPSY